MGTSVTSSLSHQDHHNLGWGFPGIWGISGERGTWTRGMCTSSQLTLDSAPQIPVPPSTSSPLFILDVKTKVIQAVHRFLVSPMRPFVHYNPMFVFLCVLAPFFCSKVFCKISPSFSFLHLKKKVSLLSVKKKLQLPFDHHFFRISVLLKVMEVSLMRKEYFSWDSLLDSVQNKTNILPF